jgi:hypothetical protein
MQIMTLQDFVLAEFNKMLAAEGRDVQVVLERPKPNLCVIDLTEKRNQPRERAITCRTR